MQSKAASVPEYLKSLPADRRRAIEAVRKVILANLDQDFEEGMQYGMIGYYVPHARFPAGYHCDPKQPLPYAALASQKNHMSVYLMAAYGDSDLAEWIKTAWAKSGKKLDMGKSCIRFKRIEDLPLDELGEAFRRVSAKKWIDIYTSMLDNRSSAKTPAKKTAPAKPKSTVKKPAK